MWPSTFATKMKLQLLFLASVLVGLAGCNAESDSPSEAGLNDAISHAHELFDDGSPEALADLYVTPPRQTREDNLRYAKAILDADLPSDYELHGTRISGQMGVSLISRPGRGVPSPLFARWENGNWRFFRSLVLWGNTNRLEHFGLSEQEMQNAVRLQEWVVAEISKGEQDVTPQSTTR